MKRLIKQTSHRKDIAFLLINSPGWQKIWLYFDSEIPVELKQIIQGMIHPESERRSSAEETFKAFESYLERNHPNICSLIKQFE